GFWWRVGWAPVVAAPFVWYAVMLWYAGYWDDSGTALHRRHRPWLLLMALVVLGLVGVLIFLYPVAFLVNMVRLSLPLVLPAGATRLLLLVYPLSIVLCISLSLDVLRHPGPSGRMMGHLARRRARPWLVATSLLLLLVSLLAAGAIIWIVASTRDSTLYSIPLSATGTIARLDLVLSSLIAVAIILLGQAVVSYEVFTGKSLPRRGLVRHWHTALLLAVLYASGAGLSMVLQVRAVYGWLLGTILTTSFLALFAWRSYSARERYMDHLRPFVASQGLYEGLVGRPDTEADRPSQGDPFRALCEEVLGTQFAYLVPIGPLATLVDRPLVYPEQGGVPAAAPNELARRLKTQDELCVPIEPDRHGGAAWAVPLWSERGLIGALLLGEKHDGSLYTQEEIEIARASGERLIDTQASAEIARRLMALQRQRLVESQVLDRRARRVLHDDVLPRVHAAMLTLNRPSHAANGGHSEVIALLGEVHRDISTLLRELPVVAAPEVARFGLVGALQRVVGDEFVDAFDAVTWEIQPLGEQQAHALPALSAEVLFYAAREASRNAARHARGLDAVRGVSLDIALRDGDGLEVVIADNGAGLQTGERSNGGSAQGLALHSTMMAVVGGSLAVDSAPGQGTRVTLTLPRPSSPE
ncbi:MAG TPA: ATP-binding protein, partial [Ardenticatenaceae bacterium]|nr:ATP-binding protein [Ardenticatenaceae bacterium]